MIKAEFVFGRSATFFDPPARSFDLNELFKRCSSRAPDSEIGEIPISWISTHEQSPNPWSAIIRRIVCSVEFCERTPQCRSPFVPCPADRDTQAFSGAFWAMSRASPAMGLSPNPHELTSGCLPRPRRSPFQHTAAPSRSLPRHKHYRQRPIIQKEDPTETALYHLTG